MRMKPSTAGQQRKMAAMLTAEPYGARSAGEYLLKISPEDIPGRYLLKQSG